MGCVQSDPYVPDGTPIEAIAFRRKSDKKKGTNSKGRNSHQQSPSVSEIATLEVAEIPPVSEWPQKKQPNEPDGIFSQQLKPNNQLAGQAQDRDAKGKKMFPVWKKNAKCTLCVSSNDVAHDVILNVAHMNPFDPRLCGQCSRTLLDSLQNNKRGVNMAIANFLAMTALDLTAPASDALLKNRKNAWIQLAGHAGSFAPAGPNTIWKKRMEKENYETKTYQALMGEAMRDVVPKFHREVEYNGEYFIEMEDLLQHFSDPNIMDIKMGKRTFLELEVKNPVLRKDLYEKMVKIDPEAATEEEKEQEAITKLRYMQFREQESSTGNLGFRIEAIRMSGEPPNTNLKKVKQREQVAEMIVDFYRYQKSFISSLLLRLIEIRDKFEHSRFFKEHEIIGSSLLMMYDAEHFGAWMIDFAKTIPVENGKILDHRSPWKIGSHEDGYLSGLDNLIQIVQEIVDGTLGQEAAAKDTS